MSGDPEFDDFLRRRRPLFRGDADDGLEPPPELDRIVLRQARDAIEGDRPIRLFGMPRWAAPVAIAATLVLGLAVVFRTGMGPVERVPEVKVESIAQRTDYPPEPEQSMRAPAPQSPADAGADGAVVVTLVPMAPPAAATEPSRGEVSRNGRRDEPPAASPTRMAADSPAWRRDAKAWQSEIERLRASGDAVRADAEQAEFNRQYRAMATSPDR
jgi:hypothetical protein